MKNTTQLKNKFYLFFILIFISCRLNQDYIDLSGDYWYVGMGLGNKTIKSKWIQYRNKIYPEVTDYAFNDKFIIAEQKPDSIAFKSSLGEDLFRRFEMYQFYNKNNKILEDTFYYRNRGVVEKDSFLYNLFIARGAAMDELKNREIGIRLAAIFISSDIYYRTIFNNKKNYWVINHSLDTLIGPLTRKAYLEQKSFLGIPANLKLYFEK